MSSPITSVPDPSENSALASMITQVQPGQTPVVVRGARPKKPPASSADPAKKKKKKQSRSAAETTETAEATQLKSQDEAVAEAARLGSQAALSQSRAASGTLPQDQDAGQHSHQASSTVMASTADNSVTNTETAAPAEKPVTEAEKEVSPPRSRAGPTEVPTQPAAPKVAAASGPSSSTASANKTPASAQPKAKPAPPSFGKRLVAFLTCSSASSAMVRSEMQEKQPAPKQASATAPGNAAASPALVVPPRTPNAKGGSQQTGEYPTTPGGGTQLPREETGDVMSGAVVPPGSAFVTPQDGQKSRQSTSSFTEDETDEEDEDDADPEDDYLTDDQTEEHRLIMQGGIGIPLDEFGNPHPLLPAIGEPDKGRKCLVLDLDETLVHSSFKMIQNADFIVPVEIDGTVHNVYVIKRPGVDEFMRLMGEIYEVVVFTASLSKYADPVLDMLDIHHSVRHRLFRESCYNHKGNYVKDLSQLGREIADSIIIDNSPASYIFHPNNAVPISSWFNDPHDTELTDLCPFLADLAHVDDVRAVLDGAL